MSAFGNQCLLSGLKRTFLRCPLSTQSVFTRAQAIFKKEPAAEQSAGSAGLPSGMKRGSPASILFVFSPFFRGIPHFMKYVERKEGHPLLLVGAQSFVERLPRISEFLEVG